MILILQGMPAYSVGPPLSIIGAWLEGRAEQAETASARLLSRSRSRSRSHSRTTRSLSSCPQIETTDATASVAAQSWVSLGLSSVR